MNRFWSLLILLAIAGSFAAFLLAATGHWPLANAWLPENYSQAGEAIDQLFYLVHWVCCFFLLLPGLLLSLFVWRFADRSRQSALYIRDNVALELVWTLIPAVVLVMLALYQMNVWRSQRVARPETDVAGVGRIPAPPLVRVVARQFGWEFHYAGRDQRSGTGDDFSVENLIVLPDDQPIVLSLESRDVIHSFFVPQLRLKHDVVPGMTHYAWFTPTRTGTMSVVCAELCGWGHTRMTGELRIVSRREFEDWQRIEQDRIDGAAD